MILGRLRILLKVVVELCQLEVYRSVVGSCSNECPFQTLDRFSRPVMSRKKIVRRTILNLTFRVPHNKPPVLARGARRMA